MLVLHIGYAKTGTTSLQKHFFPKLENVIYLGRTYPVPEIVTGSFLNKLMGLFNKMEFDNLAETLQYYIHDDSEKLREYAQQFKYAVQKLPIEKIKVFSHENLLRPSSFERTAERIHELFQDMEVKIVFTIRRQQELIMSRLNHNKAFFDLNHNDLKLHFSESMQNCIFPICNKLSDKRCHKTCAGRKKISLDYYDFNKVISAFEDVFGKDCVEVFYFEKIFKSDSEHTNRLAKLLNSDDKTISDLIRDIPHTNMAKDPENYLQFKAKFKEQCSDYLFDYYRESNAKLSARHNLRLEDAGYC